MQLLPPMQRAFHPKGVAIRRQRMVQFLKYALYFTLKAHQFHQNRTSDRRKARLIGVIRPNEKGLSSNCSFFKIAQDSI